MSGTWLAGWASNDLVSPTEFAHGIGCFYDHTTATTDASVSVTLPTWGTDIWFTFNLASNTGSDSLTLQVNSDTGANYYEQTFYAAGSTTTETDTTGSTSLIPCALPSAANYSVSGDILIRNFRNTTFYKHVIFSSFSETAATSGARTRRLDGGSWHNTAALTAVLFKPLSGSFAAGSRIRGYVSG